MAGDAGYTLVPVVCVLTWCVAVYFQFLSPSSLSPCGSRIFHLVSSSLSAAAMEDLTGVCVMQGPGQRTSDLPKRRSGIPFASSSSFMRLGLASVLLFCVQCVLLSTPLPSLPHHGDPTKAHQMGRLSHSRGVEQMGGAVSVCGVVFAGLLSTMPAHPRADFKLPARGAGGASPANLLCSPKFRDGSRIRFDTHQSDLTTSDRAAGTVG